MAEQNRNGEGFYAAIPLEAADQAVTIEIVGDMVCLTIVGPVVTTTTTFTRGEARALALAVVDASQHLDWEEE